MSKVIAIFHAVINTYNRRFTIPEEHKRDLYGYLYGICRNHKCTVFRINGIGNHIHLLLGLNPTVSIADLMKTLKQSSSIWMKGNPLFPNFEHWGKEYYASTIHYALIPTVKEYIMNQERHHTSISYEDEMKDFCLSNGIEWNDKSLT